MPLRDRLFAWMRQQPMVWRSGVAIEKIVSANTKHGGSTVTRTLRELAIEKKLQREERPWKGRKIAWYRYNPQFDGLYLARKSIEWWDSI